MSREQDNEAFARHVQARLGVAVDGWAGARTRAAFDAALPPAAPPAPSTAWDWDDRSTRALVGVHPDLVRVAALARQRSAVPFVVTEGLRSPERQAQLVRAGASQTLNSRHLTGHAIDVAALVGGKVSWDWPLYERLAVAMKAAAADLRVPVIWGGDWRTFRDGPHYELDRKAYPA
ncbi:MAG: M15 family metallopeptidase [Gemmobacter sp.]|uniref:M15 family metallopeptidase n=1 Tax=Gemmobacter sp. TaxID=1898957 RepID=UPI003918A689